MNIKHNDIIEKKIIGMINDSTLERIEEIVNNNENFIVLMYNLHEDWEEKKIIKKIKNSGNRRIYKIAALLEHEDVAEFLFIRFDKKMDFDFSENSYFIKNSPNKVNLKDIIIKLLEKNNKKKLIEIYGIGPKNSNMGKMVFQVSGLMK